MKLGRRTQYAVYIMSVALISSAFYKMAALGLWVYAVELVLAAVLVVTLRLAMLFDIRSKGK